jgi:glycine/D-amino acid oxidase-like deaminating enzyme
VIVKLTSSAPFWLLKNGLKATYPFIGDDLTTDFVVVGAGVTGAMVAQRLAEGGFKVVVVDSRDICTGSTSASTALLQYEIDIPLIQLRELIGEQPANLAYSVSSRSIDSLTELVNRLRIDCEFQRKTSIYLASDRKAAKKLADESRARKQIKLDSRYHDQSAVKERFNLDGVAAITTQQAASCDPYLLAHGLLANAVDQGARVFDRTTIVHFDHHTDSVTLTTDRGPRVVAKRAIIATGYESQGMLKERIVDLDNTYAMVSQPLQDLAGWHPDWMLWEAKDPYLYLRVTGDNRLLAGGEDDTFHTPTRRDFSVESKAKTIETKVRDLIPDLDWEREYAWSGTFGKTKDGLAYIGPSLEYPNCLFALGFGGNGITFSCIASDIIWDMARNVSTEAASLFRFGR